MKKEKLIGFWMEGKEKSTHGTTKFKKDGNEGTQDLLRWLSDFMWRVAREWRPLSRQRAPPIRSRWGGLRYTHTQPGYLPVPPFSRFWHVRTERMCIKT